MAELVALDGRGHHRQRHVGGFAPVAGVEGAVEVDEEVEERVVGPRLARQVEGVVRVRHVEQREVGVEPDGEPVKHDRVLQLFGQILGLEQPRLARREDRLREVETGGHEAEERLVARALALVTEHLEEQPLVLLGEHVPLVELVPRPAHLALEPGEPCAYALRQSGHGDAARDAAVASPAAGRAAVPPWRHAQPSCPVA